MMSTVLHQIGRVYIEVAVLTERSAAIRLCDVKETDLIQNSVSDVTYLSNHECFF